MDLLLYSNIILGQAYSEGLRQFFRASWGLDGVQEDYMYRVYITRRAFNLNELFFQIEKQHLEGMSDELDQKKKSTFITQTALWGYVDKLVDIYISSGKFPPLLIIDELVVYGHEITGVMQTFERLAKRAWRKRVPDSSELEERRLSSALLMAVDLHVYAKSGDDLLLKNSYRNQLRSDVEMSSCEWKSFTQNISRFLQMCSPNTNFIPAKCISASKYKGLMQELEHSPKWRVSKWVYRTVEEEIWQHNIESQDEWRHLQLAVRCDKPEKGDQYRLVPQAFFGSMSLDKAEQFCQCVRQVLHNQSGLVGSRITEMLDCDYKEFLSVKVQLIMYILSVITLNKFAADGGIGTLKLAEDDIERSAQCFGTIDDIYSELKILSNSKDLHTLLEDKIFTYIGNNSKLYRKTKIDYAGSDRSICVYNAERCLARAAARDESHVAAIKRANAVYDSQTRFLNVISIEDYISDHAWGKESSDQKLAVAMLMMDANIISINPYMVADEPMVGLKLGELSKLLKVRWMYRFMLALVELESYCDLYGYDVVALSVKFGRYLEQDEPSKPFASIFMKFVEEIYLCGQKIRDWYVNTVSDLDMPQRDPSCSVRTVQEWSGQDWGKEWSEIEASDSQVQYIQWELTKQTEYRRKLTNFLESKQPRQ